MLVSKVIVTNEMGIHARPAAAIVRVAGKFASDIVLIKDGIRANAKSIMNILMLAAEAGVEITMEVNGPDEQDAQTQMLQLFKDKFHDDL